MQVTNTVWEKMTIKVHQSEELMELALRSVLGKIMNGLNLVLQRTNALGTYMVSQELQLHCSQNTLGKIDDDVTTVETFQHQA